MFKEGKFENVIEILWNFPRYFENMTKSWMGILVMLKNILEPHLIGLRMIGMTYMAWMIWTCRRMTAWRRYPVLWTSSIKKYEKYQWDPRHDIGQHIQVIWCLW